MKPHLHVAAGLTAAAIACALAGCSGSKEPTTPPPPKVDAAAFVDQVNKELVDLNREINAAGWTQSTDITVDTQYLASKATERYLEFISRKAGESKVYDNDKLDPKIARALKLIKLSVSAPAPADAAKRTELAALSTELEAMRCRRCCLAVSASSRPVYCSR